MAAQRGHAAGMSLPFPGDITSTANGLLLLSLVAAILYGAAQGLGPSLRRSFARTAAIGLLAILSFVRQGPALLTLALAVAAIGNAALARRQVRATLAGFAGLLMSHLAYAALFATLWSGWDVMMREPWRAGLGIAMLALCGATAARLMRQAVEPAMRLPAAAGMIAPLAMGLAALPVPGWGPAAGAALLIVSVTLLAMSELLPPPAAEKRRQLDLAGWTTCYVSQALIALAVLS